MNPFRPAILLLFTALISQGYSAAATEYSSAAATDGAVATIAPLSQIRQSTEDTILDDSDFTDRVMEMRLGATGKIPAPGLEPWNAAQPSAPAQATAAKLYRSFKAMGATGYEPADPNVAVGPDRVVAVVNRSIAIYTKLGQKIFQTTLRDFFRPLPDIESSSILYPKVMYDAYNQHFLVLIEAIRPVDKRSWYFLAVSKTSNPQGEWAFWALNMALNGGAKTPFFADYPGLGLDQQAIYMTANMANWDYRFQYAKIRVLKKSEVYKFGKVKWHDFFKLADATGAKAISIQPAQSFGTAPVEYLLSSTATGGSKLTLWSITNPTAPSITLNKKEVSVTAYEPPPDASQKGGPLKIGTGDASMTNVVFRNGVIYSAHTITKGTNSAIRYYEIRTDGSLAQEVTYGASGKYYYFPSTMVDSKGNSVVVFNRSNGGQFVGIAYTGRKTTDPKNTLQANASLIQGKAYYHLTTRQVQYWGAYNGMALDYDDSLWMIAAFAKTPDEWDTWIGKVAY